MLLITLARYHFTDRQTDLLLCLSFGSLLLPPPPFLFLLCSLLRLSLTDLLQLLLAPPLLILQLITRTHTHTQNSKCAHANTKKHMNHKTFMNNLCQHFYVRYFCLTAVTLLETNMLDWSLNLSHRTAPSGRSSVHCKHIAQADTHTHTHTLLNMQRATAATRTGWQKDTLSAT